MTKALPVGSAIIEEAMQINGDGVLSSGTKREAQRLAKSAVKELAELEAAQVTDFRAIAREQKLKNSGVEDSEKLCKYITLIIIV